ncbi:hypothetical protein JZ751_019505 [Albula glossodonta]|uniref:Eukaryotic translation initiation factor 3 subunit K n=1 Tax=Albula glossodonta TaxID=121402 RepID=A0A8T2MTB6_9TELE|nr:hypothetical protein JZ751_019505 [Albula glossodonta]
MASSFEQMRANVGKLLRGIDRYNPENLATLERYVETQAKENAYDLEANLAVLKLYQFNPAYFQTTVTSQILLKALTNLPHTDFTLCKCMIDQTHVSFRDHSVHPRLSCTLTSCGHNNHHRPAGEMAVSQQEERPIRQILYLGNLLETCHFQSFWVLTVCRPPSLDQLEFVIKQPCQEHRWTGCHCYISDSQQDILCASLEENRELIDGITGFEDSVRKFICHVVGITYQNIEHRLLAEMLGDPLDTQVKVWMSKYGWTESEDGQIFIFNQEESVKPKNIVEKIDFESVSSIMATSQ